MQLVAACYGKQFVVNVHAIFFVLRRVSWLELGMMMVVAGGERSLPHRTGTCRCLVESHGTAGHFPGSCCCEQARAIWQELEIELGSRAGELENWAGGGTQRGEARGGEGSRLTHSMPL